jgi:hypothetical protein
MTVDDLIKVFLLPFLVAAGTAVVGAYLNRRSTLAKASADSSDAAESLSNAAAKQVEVYQQAVIAPMQKRIDSLVAQISVMEEDRRNDMAERDRERTTLRDNVRALERKTEDLDRQVQFLRGELRRSDTALELIISVAQVTYPEQAKQALKIRRGEL